MKDTHAELRVLAFKKKLSMQAIIEGLVSRLVNGEPALTRMVEKMSEDKGKADLRKVIGTDAESVYDILENLDSIKGD